MDPKGEDKKGDLVAIYVTAPVQAIRYVCRCLEAQLEQTDDPDEARAQKWMKVELLAQFSDDLFPREKMIGLGVRAVRGPRRMTKDLMQAVKKALTGSSGVK